MIKISKSKLFILLFLLITGVLIFHTFDRLDVNSYSFNVNYGKYLNLYKSIMLKHLLNASTEMEPVYLIGCKIPELTVRIGIDKSPATMADIERYLARDMGGKVELGGKYKPSNCSVHNKTAIIVPFRKREQQLTVFLRHIHPILIKQQLDYTIYVVEQMGTTPFNRGALFNIGFIEALKRDNYTCFVFSDVDLLPESELNMYNCHMSPLHMSSSVDTFNYELPYSTIFGGVEGFHVDHFKTVNGFSNLYWGWGGEDDDLYKRILFVGLKLERPPLYIGRYTMNKLYHEVSDGPNPLRLKLLKNTESRVDIDGISNTQYEIKEVVEHKLYTHLIIHTSPSMYNILT